MKILILGADGYLGWPTTLHFAEQGHEVIAVDDYSKRQLLEDNGVDSLIPTKMLGERRYPRIENFFYYPDRLDIIQDKDILFDLLSVEKPDVIIHYAEQPSAPYSMISQETAAYTLHNNVMGTLNLICAIKESGTNPHLIKFGSMGEYGQPNIDIEEGWLDVYATHGGKETFLYPRNPGSLYHVTKVMDTDMLWFYTKQWGLKVTDIMQGVVYGVTTPEIDKHKSPTNFYYDEIFGTVINRFVAQAIAGYPFTVYGGGKQQRTFLNLKDVLQCLDLVIEHPPEDGKMQIINQFTERMSILTLAEIVKKAACKLGLKPQIENKPNLRHEKQEHYYNVPAGKLLEWGLNPVTLEYSIDEMFEALMPYKNRINEDVIYKGVKWRK